MGKKLTHKEVVERLLVLGWNWIDPIPYKSSRLSNNVKLQCVKCKYTNRFHIRYMLDSYADCPNCSEGRRPLRRTKNHVIDIGKSKGFELLSTSYQNGTKSLKWKCLRCDNKVTLSSNLMSLRLLKYCDDCKDDKRKNSNKKQIIKTVKNKGGKLKEDFIYVDGKTKFSVICEQGHEFKTCWNYIQQGNWCPTCIIIHEERLLKIIKKKLGRISKNFKYINASEKFQIKCIKNHKFESTATKIAAGHWCPYCRSKTQEEFRKVIEKYFEDRFPISKPKWLLFDKANLKTRLELDGYNKELNIAFEYQGEQHYNKNNYYHQCSIIGKKESWNKLKEHDAFKINKCKNKGILLIVVPYWIPKSQWIIGIRNKYKKYREFLCQSL